MLSELEHGDVRGKFSRHLLQTSERQMISHAQVVFVVTTVNAAMGGPTPGPLTSFRITISGKTALWPHETERGERGQPIKPLSRVRGELERTLLWADGYIETLCPIFDEGSDPGACSQFHWQEASPWTHIESSSARWVRLLGR
jgi:hypothetical protein